MLGKYPSELMSFYMRNKSRIENIYGISCEEEIAQ